MSTSDQVRSLEQLLGVMPYSEEVLVSAQQRAPRVGPDVCVHVVVAKPGGGGLAEGGGLGRFGDLPVFLICVRVCNTCLYYTIFDTFAILWFRLGKTQCMDRIIII